MTPRTTPEHLAYAIAQDANSIGWQELYRRVSDVIHAHGEACYNAGFGDGQASCSGPPPQLQPIEKYGPSKRKRG